MHLKYILLNYRNIDDDFGLSRKLKYVKII